ncbi:hypothetical protein SBRCBS47491_008999 [Sporothrix bragantina]|uniref:Integral membrane protein n=1 Tax=Sporothrix bragantina TaxID=671064 RepID=A0ABP0CSM4_9PEZI
MLNDINPKAAAADEPGLAPVDSASHQEQQPQQELKPQREEGPQQQWPADAPVSGFHAWGFKSLHLFFMLVAFATAGVAAAYLVDGLDYGAVSYHRPVTITACVFANLASIWSIRLHRRRSPKLPAVALTLDAISLLAAILSLLLQDLAASYWQSQFGVPWLAMTATMMATRVVSIIMTLVLAFTTVEQWKQQRAAMGV